jgi:hypothetical protein
MVVCFDVAVGIDKSKANNTVGRGPSHVAVMLVGGRGRGRERRREGEV